jgi:hypothetical protein
LIKSSCRPSTLWIHHKINPKKEKHWDSRRCEHFSWCSDHSVEPSITTTFGFRTLTFDLLTLLEESRSCRCEEDLMTHSEAHVGSNVSVSWSSIGVFQNEVLILNVPIYMWEPLNQFTPIEWWFGLHNSEPTGGTEDLNTEEFNGEVFNITNDVSFDLKDLLGLNSQFIKPMCIFFLHGF